MANDIVAPSPGGLLTPTGMGPTSGMPDMSAPMNGNRPSSSIQGRSYTDKNTPQGRMLWQINKWEYYYCAYFDEGGFSDKTVLTKAINELDDQFMERRNYSVYPNYVRPIIDATYTPVFTKPAKRITTVNGKEDTDGTAAPIWAAFRKDVDHRGSDMPTMAERFTKHARILGVSYVIGDAPREVSASESNAVVDLVKDRKYPWISMRLPQQVIQELLVLDDFCNLQEIVFIEADDRTTGEPRAKKWTKEYCCMMKKDKKTSAWVEMNETRVVYYLESVPVIPIISSESQDATVIPKSQFASVIDCNLAIFNILSELRRMGRSQMFPILCLPNMQGTFIASVSNGISLPANDQNVTYPLPMFLAPDVSPYESIKETINFLVGELIRVSGQQGVLGVPKSGPATQAPSGIEASFEFMGQNWVLLKSADIAEKVEKAIVKLFKLYVPEPFEYTAEYSKDYQPTHVAVQAGIDKDFLTEVSTLSTPFNPVVALALSDWISAIYDIDNEDVKDVLKWIKDNTSKKTEPGEAKPPVDEEAANNDKIIKFLKDTNRLPNAAARKFQKQQEPVAA